MNGPEFTYHSYRQILRKAVKIAPVVPLRDAIDGIPKIILRHDVDFCVNCAYEMFLLERDLGVRGSYFFMTSSYSYNILDHDNRRMIRTIAENDFDIGLHFDPTLYPGMDDKQLYEKCIFEAAIIKEAAGKNVISVSLHNPTSHGQYLLFRNMINAYSPELFSDDCYISDSCMDFRGKDILTFLERAYFQTIQMLIHPMHWHERQLTYCKIFDRYINYMKERIHNGYQINKTYLKQCPKGYHQEGQ